MSDKLQSHFIFRGDMINLLRKWNIEEW